MDFLYDAEDKEFCVKIVNELLIKNNKLLASREFEILVKRVM